MLTRADIEHYFLAEKTGGIVFFVVGALCVVASLLFIFVMKTPFFKGASVPLVLGGLLFCFVGYTVFERSDRDRIALVYAFDMNPDRLKNNELPRMEQVMKRFVVYRYAAIVLFLLGLSLFLYCRRMHSFPNWGGAGAALVFIAFATLLLDSFAQNRGKTYHQKLSAFCAGIR